MAPNPRPSLTSLADRMAKKDTPAAPAHEAQAAELKTPAEPKDARVQVLVRMLPAERKALRQIALDGDTTVQALVEDAIRDLLRRHGHSQA
ncbi:MAG: ribbon-helix-helix domain-containing protein [Janthinobacterium lividum]